MKPQTLSWTRTIAFFKEKLNKKIDYGIRNFALLDDIAALMDDVVVMSKIAQNSRHIRDDLAANAEKASGFVSQRNSVLWAITKDLFKQIDNPTARFVLFCTLVNHSRTYIRRYLSCISKVPKNIRIHSSS
jgi:hypothetical protein